MGRHLRLAAALLGFWVFGSLPALGQEQLPFGFQLTEWNQTLDEVARAAEGADLSGPRVEALKARLADVRSQALRARDAAEAELKPIRAKLEALGPPPEEGQPPESTDIAKQRETLEGDAAELESRIKQAGLIVTRANELDTAITALSRRRLIEEVSTRLPFPLAPDTLAVAVPEFLGIVLWIIRQPGEWIEQAPEEDMRRFFLRTSLVLSIAFALGLGIRVLTRRRFGRDPEILEPSYARCLWAAIAEAVAGGIIPALVFAGILYRVISHDTLISGAFADITVGFCAGMILIILSWALSRAVLAPDQPQWRLMDITAGHARRISWVISCLATVVAIDLFLRLSSESLESSRSLQSVYLLVLNGLEGGFFLALLRGSLWQRDPTTAIPEDDDEEPEDGEPHTRHRFWRLLRLVAIAVAAVAIAAPLFGYAYLGAYLMENLLIAGIIVAVLTLVRGLFRELIGAAFRSGLLQTQLGIRHSTRALFKFWFRLALDAGLLVIGVLLLAPPLGLPFGDVLRWTGEALRGFEIGGIRISIVNIAIALAALLTGMLLTRMVQRTLEERVLPKTRLDIGVRNSVKAGIGYLGITLAALIAFSLLGLDLSNLAIIAGALSVGIGFGLQTIVNNFVSGLILLAERPVKAGDWIVVAGHEGIVKRINVRATELQTFQRASVIIPNSELLSSSVINWTHKDSYGRVEAYVGVAYGSDVEQVQKILLDCMASHAKILKAPEPYCWFMNFGESSLDFTVRGYIDNVLDVYTVRSEVLTAINQALAEAGIEIPFPQRDLNLRDIDRLEAALGGRPRPKVARVTPIARDGEGVAS